MVTDNRPHCAVCGRVLKSKKSIARGMGSACYGKVKKGINAVHSFTNIVKNTLQPVYEHGSNITE